MPNDTSLACAPSCRSRSTRRSSSSWISSTLRRDWRQRPDPLRQLLLPGADRGREQAGRARRGPRLSPRQRPQRPRITGFGHQPHPDRMPITTAETLIWTRNTRRRGRTESPPHAPNHGEGDQEPEPDPARPEVPTRRRQGPDQQHQHTQGRGQGGQTPNQAPAPGWSRRHSFTVRLVVCQLHDHIVTPPPGLCQ